MKSCQLVVSIKKNFGIPAVLCTSMKEISLKKFFVTNAEKLKLVGVSAKSFMGIQQFTLIYTYRP